MLFMYINTWEPSQRDEVGKRRLESGSTFPEGLKVIGEWIDMSGGLGFALVETDNPSQLLAATRSWSDLVDIELIPVLGTTEVVQHIQQE
jgi:hypothetical protein